MSKLLWDETGKKFYETGVSDVALYVYDKKTSKYGNGVAWNGVTAISESTSGGESNPFYADNQKYLNLVSAEDYASTIEAYTYPDAFAACDGSAELAPGVTIGQQSRSTFGLVYKTIIGNDTEFTSHGYKLHIVYGALAAPSERAHNTINDTPEAMTMSWELSTTPVKVDGFKPTATVVIDSTKVDATKLKTLEDKLYGTNGASSPETGTEPTLLMPNEIAAIVKTEG